MTDDIVALLKAGHYTAYNSKRAYEEIERLRADLDAAKRVIENIVESEVEPLRAILREARSLKQSLEVMHAAMDCVYL